MHDDFIMLKELQQKKRKIILDLIVPDKAELPWYWELAVAQKLQIMNSYSIRPNTAPNIDI